MRRRKIATLMLIFVLAVAVRLVLDPTGVQNQPKAHDGVIDLKSWRFAEDGPIDLAGEWQFVSGQFLEPSTVVEAAAEGLRTVQVPDGGWDDYIAEGERTPFGAGTYVLTVLLPDIGDEAFGIRTTNVRSAHRLYIDGEAVGERGTPGLSRSATKPANSPYAVPVGTAGESIVIVLHAANYHYAAQGGLFEPLTFGLLPDIYRQQEREGAFDAAIAASFAGGGTVLLLFYLFRRRSTEFGHFGLLFMLAGIYWVTHGNKLIIEFIPTISYTVVSRLQLLSTIGAPVALLMFARAINPEAVHRHIVRFALVMVAWQSIVTLTAPVQWITRMDPFVIYYGLLIGAYALLMLVRGTLTKPDEPLYTLAGVLSMFHYALFQGLYFAGITDAAPTPLFEVAMFISCMGMLLAKRFLLTLDNVEVLSGKLVIANRLKDEFMTNTSYELRAPLRGIINLAELMLDESSGDPRQVERLGLLLTSGRRLAYLLDEMLDLTKLNEGAVELRLRAVDVRLTAEAVLDLTAHLSGPARGTLPLANRVPPGTPLVRADANRLLQMMLNLVHEALQRTGTHTVEMTAEPDEDGRMLWIVIERQGIEAEAPYEERLETAVSRKLAELQGGELRVEQCPSAGTIVRFSLPIEQTGVLTDDVLPGQTAGQAPAWMNPGAAQAAAAAAHTTAAHSASPAPARPDAPRVLLAEDDPHALQMMTDLLAREGLAVTTVRTGVQALVELERSADWELVVADTMLPVLSGLELCRQIRERFSLADLPVLLMTRRGGTVDLLVGFEAGASDMIVKPLDTAELTGRVRTLIRMKQSVKEQLLTEIALMQAQIKPHFLFNTLNTIAGLSESDPEQMRELLHDFGQYLRASFDARNLERLVPFEQEWSLVTTYMQIEQARFGERIQIETAIEEELRFRLPPLTVQPIVENALRHGILKRIEGGCITVSVARDTQSGGDVRIEVTDDGVGFPPGRAEDVLRGTYAGGIGLTNVHRRLMTYYGRGLEIESGPSAGTVIRFRIPIEEGNAS